MRLSVSLFMVFLFLTSCGDRVENESMENSFISSEVTFGNSAVSVILSEPQVENLIRQWPNLESFINEVRLLKGISYSDLRNKSEILKRHSYSAFDDVPAVFDTQIINSRLLVLQTRSEVLYQWAHNDFVDSDELEIAISEINQAVNNLLLQLSEKLNKDQIDLQRISDEQSELKKQTKFRDSVYDAELKDMQRN